MSSGKRRLDKLESQLSPKQAMLLWMAEVHQFQTVQEYARHKMTQPDSASPLRRLGEQTVASVQRALKGESKEKLDRAIRQAYLDILFLVYLHNQVNCWLAEKDRYLLSHSLLLAQQLSALALENFHNEQALWNRFLVGLGMPYPLDPETAQAVDAAIENHLFQWEVLDDGDEIDQWLLDSYRVEGKTELPEGAYRLRRDYTGSFKIPDPEEIRARFPNQEGFDKFLAGDDYSYGLADVTDAEFSERYETTVSAMTNVGLDGLMVELPTVPQAFLREAPLVDDEWINQYVVELAEWGAGLAQQGFLVEESDDPHPLAWFRITNPEEGKEASGDLPRKLWQQTRNRLERFPGRTREIDGRKYLNWEDYLGWRDRRVKINVRSRLSPGLVVSRWNQWVEEQSGEGRATLAGTLVGKLSCHVQGYQYQVHEGTEGLDLKRRQSLLESLWMNRPGSKAEERFFERVRVWKELAHQFLIELHTLRRVINSVNQHYYEGQQALFPQVAQDFEELLENIKELVEQYNRDLAVRLERHAAAQQVGDSRKSVERFSLDMSSLDELTEKPAGRDVAYLVNMARVEALDTMGESRKAAKLLDSMFDKPKLWANL